MNNLLFLNESARLHHLALQNVNRHLILVVSNKHPNGALMTEEAYLEFKESMSQEDKATHQKAAIDPSMATLLDLEVFVKGQKT